LSTWSDLSTTSLGMSDKGMYPWEEIYAMDLRVKKHKTLMTAAQNSNQQLST